MKDKLNRFIGFKISEAGLEKLKAQAAKARRTLSDWIRLILEDAK